MKSLAPGSLYVVDASLRVVLAGASPLELARPPADGVRLPLEFEAPLAELLRKHDFEREPIARAVGASASSRSEVALRCIRAAGPAGPFYMLMAQPLHAAFEAVA